MTDKQKKIAGWRKKISMYEEELRDICRKIADGEIEIGSEEFNLSTEIIDGNSGRMHAYQEMIDDLEEVDADDDDD